MTRAAPDIEVVCDIVHKVGESPLWDDRAQALWWVDAMGHEIRRRGSDGTIRTFSTAFQPSALALSEDGGVVVAAGMGLHRLDPETGTTEQLVSVEDALQDTRLNDGVVDTAGRFWVGSMHASPERAPIGRLHCFASGSAVTKLDGLRTQNGAAVSPDGKTFYLADSHPDVCMIWAFDLDATTGELENQRVFHRPQRGRPDGAAIDADGCYWFAAVDGASLVRLDPDGAVMRTVDLPVSRPTKPAFGGSELDILFLTTMSLGLNEAQRAAEPMSGKVLALDVRTRGRVQPRAKVIPAGASSRPVACAL